MKPYLKLSFLILWIFVVLFLFQIIPERKVAALIAGFGFLIIPLVLAWQELRDSRRSRLALLSIFQFVFIFVIPILTKRLLYWEEDFRNFTFLGISAIEWHRYSAFSFFLMISGLVFTIAKKEKKQAR